LPEALAEYRRARDSIVGHGRESWQWLVLLRAALLAVDDEVRAASGDAMPGALDVDDARRTARDQRVSAIVMLRLRPWFLDLPVIATGIVGVALWGARTGELDRGTVAELWASAVRFGSRQDFAVLRLDRLRPRLAALLGDDRILADAERAVASGDRDGVIAATIATLTAIRIPR
jgi:hypothetical protein